MKDEIIQLDDREFRLSRLIDGDLRPEERAELERELAGDTGLQRTLDELRRTDRWVRSASVPEPDWDRFREQIHWRCRSARGGLRRAILRIGMPAAAAAALALAVLLRFNGGEEPAAPGALAAVEFVEVQVGRAELAAASGVTTVVEISIERTPPTADWADEETDDEQGSYVIAAAGAIGANSYSSLPEMEPTF